MFIDDSIAKHSIDRTSLRVQVYSKSGMNFSKFYSLEQGKRTITVGQLFLRFLTTFLQMQTILSPTCLKFNKPKLLSLNL